MAYGKDAAFYAAQGPDHKVNASRPDLAEENVLLMTMFQTLSPSRPVYFGGPGAIPLVEIEAYCRLAGFAPEERLDLVEQIRWMDLLFLDLMDKRKGAATTLTQPKGA